MDTITDPQSAVNPDPDALALAAVCELRADWIAERPTDDYGPPPTSFTLIDDREPEPPLEALYGVDDLLPDESPGEYPNFVPSAEDEAWYRECCRETEERLWEMRVEAGPTFVEELYDLANELIDGPNETRAWAGKQVAKLAEQARWLEAKSGDQFDDRLSAHLDAIAANR
jgi:hypothetical protein